MISLLQFAAYLLFSSLFLSTTFLTIYYVHSSLALPRLQRSLPPSLPLYPTPQSISSSVYW